MKVTIEIDTAHFAKTGEMRLSHQIEGAETLQDYINIGTAFELAKRMIVKLLQENAAEEMIVHAKIRGEKKKEKYLRETRINFPTK